MPLAQAVGRVLFTATRRNIVHSEDDVAAIRIGQRHHIADHLELVLTRALADQVVAALVIQACLLAAQPYERQELARTRPRPKPTWRLREFPHRAQKLLVARSYRSPFPSRSQRLLSPKLQHAPRTEHNRVS